jgi:hypothetical protein
MMCANRTLVDRRRLICGLTVASSLAAMRRMGVMVIECRPVLSPGVRAVGECYLSAYPEEASHDRLRALIPHNLRSLGLQVRKDFEEDDLVSVQGWLMSRAECRACALAVLSNPLVIP